MDKRLWLIVAAIVLSVAAYNFYEDLPKLEYFGKVRKPFYYVSALSVLCSAIALYSIKKHPVTFAYLAIIINAVLDELLFDATVSQYSEYCFGVLVFIYAVWYFDKSKNEETDSD